MHSPEKNYIFFITIIKRNENLSNARNWVFFSNELYIFKKKHCIFLVRIYKLFIGHNLIRRHKSLQIQFSLFNNTDFFPYIIHLKKNTLYFPSRFPEAIPWITICWNKTEKIHFIFHEFWITLKFFFTCPISID